MDDVGGLGHDDGDGENQSIRLKNRKRHTTPRLSKGMMMMMVMMVMVVNVFLRGCSAVVPYVQHVRY